MDALADLLRIVAALRAPDGCSWDRAQTGRTLRPYLLEEAYEAVDALESQDFDAQKKELGDVLFLVTMLAQIASEQGAYTLNDVAATASAKMIARHPHVFDPDYKRVGNEGDIAPWEARKAKERSETSSAVDGVPKALPALLRAHRIGEKASRVGFDWPDRTGVRIKVSEELAELDEALETGDEAAITEEFGDVLFSLVNLGRFLPTGAEDALRAATTKFETRFRAVEASLAAEGRSVHTATAEELEARWQQVKRGAL